MAFFDCRITLLQVTRNKINKDIYDAQRDLQGLDQAGTILCNAPPELPCLGPTKDADTDVKILQQQIENLYRSLKTITNEYIRLERTTSEKSRAEFGTIAQNRNEGPNSANRSHRVADERLSALKRALNSKKRTLQKHHITLDKTLARI